MAETAVAVRERPILFTGEMVRAILDGRKTQTRRVVKLNAAGRVQLRGRQWHIDDPNAVLACPYGQPGDRLWVRETWADTNGENGPMVSYRAGGDRFLVDDSYPVDYSRYPGGHFTMWCGDLRRGEPGHSWRPSIHMPRWASRITLEITDVRVERLAEITDEDAIAEGVKDWGHRPEEPLYTCGDFRDCCPRSVFFQLWDEINLKRGCGVMSDPWVWVVSFRQVSP